MVNSDMILSASVNVELLSEERTRHRRAFDMPTGEAETPRTLPTKFFIRFPQYEISGVIFLGMFVYAVALFLILHINAAELTVSHEASRVEVNAVARAISIPFLFEGFDKRYLFRNIIARAWEGDLFCVDI